jgi:hypothetical protein
MAVKPSVLGAVREKFLADAVLAPLIPGGVHTNELPANPTYTACVLRWSRTDFQYQTLGPSGEKATLWNPLLEVWFDCLKAEDGEVAAGAAFDLFLANTLPYSGGQVVQCLPDDFYLAPEVGRNARGDKQYSWCLPTRLKFLRVSH